MSISRFASERFPPMYESGPTIVDVCVDETARSAVMRFDLSESSTFSVLENDRQKRWKNLLEAAKKSATF